MDFYKQPPPWCEEILKVELDELNNPAELKIIEGDKGEHDLENAIL